MNRAGGHRGTGRIDPATVVPPTSSSGVIPPEKSYSITDAGAAVMDLGIEADLSISPVKQLVNEIVGLRLRFKALRAFLEEELESAKRDQGECGINSVASGEAEGRCSAYKAALEQLV